MNKDSIIEKLRKLLALSKSDNQHEAEMAAQKMSELMQAHQIEKADVLLADRKSMEIQETFYQVEGQKMRLLWIDELAGACASLFGGMILANGRLWSHSFHFIGPAGEMEAARMLFEHLYKSWFSIVERDLETAKEEHRFKFCGLSLWEPKHTMKFKAGHALAYASAIRARCSRLVKEREAAVEASSHTGRELVLVQNAILKDYEEQKRKSGEWGVSTPKPSQGNSAGREAGRKAGNGIALGGAVSETRMISGPRK